MRKLKEPPESLLEISPGRTVSISKQGVTDLIKVLGPINFIVLAALASVSWLAYCLADKGITTNVNINLGLSLSKRGKKQKTDQPSTKD